MFARKMYKISMIVMMAVLLNAGCLYAASYTWQGGTGDWATASNWLRDSVTATSPPNSADDVTINTGTPIVNGGDCKNLTIASGAGLTLNSSLATNGIVINNGTITGSAELWVNLSVQGIGNFNNLSCAGVTSLLSDITVNNLSSVSGTSTINANNHNITVRGNWTVHGIFIPGTGTVIFDGTNQTISGNSTTFYNLTKTVSGEDTLNFYAGATQTVTGTLTLKGSPGNLLSLRSTITGDQWKINVQGIRDLQYLDVKDSANLSTSPMIAKNSVDSGNTTDWTFILNPTVTTTAASAVTANGATTGGNVTSDGGDTVTARGVCYGTTANPAVGVTGVTCVPASAGGIGQFTVNLTGLTAATLYHIRAYATNSAGTEYGSDLIFTTSSLPTPTICTWTGGSQNSVWNDPGNWDTGSVPALSDSVLIPGSLASGANWPVIGNDTSVTIANLTIGQRTDSVSTIIPDPSLAIGNLATLNVSDSLKNNGAIGLITGSRLIVNGSFINGDAAPANNSRSATIDVQLSAQLIVNGTDLQNKQYGLIRGRGTIYVTPITAYPAASFINEGKVEPGALYLDLLPRTPPYFFGGTLTINGAFQQKSNGWLLIDVRPQNNLFWDTTSAPAFNYLKINGTAEIGGNLIFRTMDYVPSGNYDVVLASGCSQSPCIVRQSVPNVSGIPGASADNTSGTILRVTVTCSVYKWNGSTSDWTTPSNWTGNPTSAPNDSSVSVVIPDTANKPQISSTVDICGITLEDGASLNVNSGGTLNIHGGGYYKGSGITINGALNLLGGDHYIKSGFSFSGTGTLKFGSSSDYPWIYAMGNLNLNVPLRWEGGVVEPASGVSSQLTMTLDKDAEIGSDTFKKLYGMDLIVSGGHTVSLKTGKFCLGNMAKFKIGSGAFLSVDEHQMAFRSYDSGSGSLINNGTIKGAGTLSFPQLDCYDQQTTYAPVTFDNSNGTIAPGTNIGRLTISSQNYTQTGTLEIEINNPSTGTGGTSDVPGSTYDQLAITGNSSLTLGGTLNVKLPSSGYVPSGSIMILTSAGLPGSGNFAYVKVNNDNPLTVDSSGKFSSAAYEGTVTPVNTGTSGNYAELKITKKTAVYTLAVYVSPSGSGSVSVYRISGGNTARSDCSSSCSYSFPAGSRISLYAMPASGYRFSGWNEASAASSSPQEAYVTMDGNKSVTAYFASDSPYLPEDYCPNDPNKTEPGKCGCGVADTDTDGDGVPDCLDKCPNDPKKTEPGICGCGVADTDTDGDGVPDCLDKCPNDPKKTEPGKCGCGVADTDTDKDGVPDCLDKCPNDLNKTEPGKCGCGVADTDTDKDGVPDCLDKCPNDPNKTEPGKCGCGIPETETCGKCPTGSLKTEPGKCGCNTADTDTDKDGVPDCLDKCPNDPKKTEPGICGCGIADTDSIGDGITDCLRGDPPKPPVLLSPKLQEITAHSPVRLSASSFSASGNQTHIETHWLTRRADTPAKDAFFSDHTMTSGDLTAYDFSEAFSGMKYFCKVGYKGSGNIRISWSSESSFIVGTSEQSPVIEIPAGETAAQYRMFSIPYWMQNEDAAAVLGAVIGTYNTKMFRIGTFDADTGGYVEYGEGMKIIPGRAYWILARNGVKLTVAGVPVSLNQTIEVVLDNGWNMIGVPNYADYDWDRVEVMVYDDNLNVIYGPAPVSAKNSQNYIETLWQWQNGDYVTADTMEKNSGYWVKAKQSGVVLRFPETARGKAAVRARRSADNSEKPPMPMGNTGFSVNSDTGDAAGGCFINSAAQK